MIAYRTIFLLFFVSALAAGQTDVGLLKEIYGSQDLATIAGNGRLAVGVDPSGRVTLCRWPSPGLQDHLGFGGPAADSSRKDAHPGQGLQWGVEIDGERMWLSDERWNVVQRYGPLSAAALRTTARLPGSPVVLTQTITVHPESDLMILRLAVTGVDDPPRIFWYANFSPVTRRPLPELPVAKWMDGSLDDFAAFTENDGAAVYHFRPNAPGRRDWLLAEELAKSGASPDLWRSFREGTWISYASPQSTLAAYCGSGLLSPETAVQEHLNGAPRDSAAVGACYSVVEFAPAHENNRFVTTLYIAFGNSAQSASAVRQGALETGYDALTQNAIARSNQWLDSARRRIQLEPQSLRLFDQALLTLATCTDATSWAIVRSPSARPPLARDWPRHGAWMTYAFDLAGYTAIAEKHTLFYLDAVRTTHRRGAPAGSLPHALYGDGTPAAPHLFLDTEAVAWTLWSIQKHSTFIEGARRLAYLRKVWEPVLLSTEFLAGWSDAGRGAPLHSFDPATLRDAKSKDLLVATRLGLASALGIAKALGKTPPEDWTRRLGELDALLEILLMNPGASWELDEALPFTLDAIIDLDDPRLTNAIDKRLEALPELHGYAAAKALSEVAMLWQNNPSKLRGLRPLVAPMLERTFSAAGDARTLALPDALAAAHATIATVLIHQQPR